MKIRLFALLALIVLAAGSAGAAPGYLPAAPQAGESRLFWHSPQSLAGMGSVADAAFDRARPGEALLLASAPALPGTVLHSGDHGDTWQVKPNWAPADSRTPFRLLYGEAAGTYYIHGPVSLYRTADAGGSWSQLPYPAGCNFIVTMIAHPVSPTILYAGTSNGFVRSLNGGQSWLSSNPEVCNDGPHAFTLAAGVDEPNVLYAGESDNYGGGVYRSNDYGATWAPVRTGLPTVPNSTPQRFQSVRTVLVDPRDADVAYAQTENGPIYKTVNGGQQWTLFIGAPGGDYISLASIEPTHGHRIYGSGAIGHGEDGVYVIEDGGTFWSRLPIVNQGGGGPVVVDPHDSTRIIHWNIVRLDITHVLRSQVALPVVSVPE